MDGIFYHATNIEFDIFDPELAATKGATNGYLGVWTSVDQEGCEMFGDVVMKLEMPNVSPYCLPYRKLRRLHSEALEHEDGGKEMYQALARKLISDGYNVIYIMEEGDTLEQAILIDIDKIKVLEHIRSKSATPSNWGACKYGN